MKPTMSSQEQALFISFVACAAQYFEYGLGGSTVLAARHVQRGVSGVDSSFEWVKSVSDEISQHGCEVSLRHVDVGPTGTWGNPVGTHYRDRFPRYHRAIDDFDVRNIGFVFVDGRFRVACALYAASVCQLGVPVGVHDYFVRPEYSILQKRLKLIARSGSLAIFVRDPSISGRVLLRSIDEFAFDPR